MYTFYIYIYIFHTQENRASAIKTYINNHVDKLDIPKCTQSHAMTFIRWIYLYNTSLETKRLKTTISNTFEINNNEHPNFKNVARHAALDIDSYFLTAVECVDDNSKYLQFCQDNPLYFIRKERGFCNVIRTSKIVKQLTKDVKDQLINFNEVWKDIISWKIYMLTQKATTESWKKVAAYIPISNKHIMDLPPAVLVKYLIALEIDGKNIKQRLLQYQKDLDYWMTKLDVDKSADILLTNISTQIYTPIHFRWGFRNLCQGMDQLFPRIKAPQKILTILNKTLISIIKNESYLIEVMDERTGERIKQLKGDILIHFQIDGNIDIYIEEAYEFKKLKTLDWMRIC